MAIGVPFSEERVVPRWKNFHGTITARIPKYVLIDVPGEIDPLNPPPRRLERHGAAVRAVIDHCLEHDEKLRVLGSRWSLSNVVKPEQVVVDPANLNVLLQVPPAWLSADYRGDRHDRGYRPIYAQGGAEISYINRKLTQMDLALQTSGAGDGHRIAGCIATGTHGAAIDVGAVHDTVLGLHVVVGDGARFIHRGTGRVFGGEVAAWLEAATGIPTKDDPDDERFFASLVGLGSLGFVFGVVFEAAPLYWLRRRIINRPLWDRDVWAAIGQVDSSTLHPDVGERPYHFDVVLNPYARRERSGAHATVMWKEEGLHMPDPDRPPPRPQMPSDLVSFVGVLSDALDDLFTTNIIGRVITDELERRFSPGGDRPPQFPSVAFGPADLPPGIGTSTEIVVKASFARQAVETIVEILDEEAFNGNLLLGAIGLRFVAGTQALLGMNVPERTCFIELPSIRNQEVLDLYQRFWDALEARGIPFTCHWGQILDLNPTRLATYFGDRVTRWQRARRQILATDRERRVFASPLLREVGLDPEEP